MSTLDLNPTAASLLGFLLQAPRTGWDLAGDIEESVGYFWNVTRSQVYRELKTLAAEGLVAVGEAGPRDRLPYEITEAGRVAFSAWLAAEPSAEILRLPIVVKVFFGEHLAPETLRRHLGAARAQHAATLAEYESIWTMPDGPKSPYQRKALELGLAYERMFLAWLDELPWARPAGEKAPAKRMRKKTPKPC